jgi:hypothetical protein
MKRKAIGSNPLDLIVPASSQEETRPPERPAEKKAKTTATVAGKGRGAAKPSADAAAPKRHFTVLVQDDIVERTKRAVYWTPGMTMSYLAEEALTEYVDRMEKKRGESFPDRESELTRGRRMS